ncbi:EAL domain-containing protein (putative c-di-GMP-specific phosphodiesterase class I) [Streptosporangium album]|uniref:EAL domain-containing protein (Putative c-di-GMP-specific phosphodiesterase class I) n=1 Tax=Streptosporangium album TaxID=47479 RepID=A0A7W7S1H2_9ACTN|nr:EAL domain-containing protein [Streptosporangium album]MBB4942183.1 EAL domain-containing protein (putative c-di-GMP-specific phosphodiesterase class I) [Streptosporangium album]
MASRTHLSPASAAGAVNITPIVDLDTGGVIALQAVGEHHGTIASLTETLLRAAGSELLLPLVIGLPTETVIGGPAALAPLHEALRMSGRRPREVILVLRGGFSGTERRPLITGLDGLRAIGYLIAVGDLGTGHIPMDLLTDAAPYLAVLSPDLMARITQDPRRAALAEALARLARDVGAHVLAPGVTQEAQLTAVRSWGVRLAQGPLLTPGPSGRIRVPLPSVEEEPARILHGPRVQEFLLPAATLPYEATAEEAAGAFGGEPSITSVILVDEYQRPKASLDRSRFLLSIAGRFGHALHGKKPAARLAEPARTVPKTTSAIAAMQVAGRDADRVYDDLVVVDEFGRCMGIVRMSDLIRQMAVER